MKQVSKEPWFCKKGAATGFRPISWQGWLVSLVFVVIIIGLILMTYVDYQYVWRIEGVVILTIIVFIVTVMLTTEKTKN